MAGDLRDDPADDKMIRFETTLKESEYVLEKV